MKYRQSALHLAIFTAATFVLAACGGGGGGSNSTPATVVNTTSTHYLPLAAGNTWTLASGASFVDQGPVTLTCTCPANGQPVERVDLLQAVSNGLLGSFFFTKYTPSGTFSELTALIGIEQAGATTIAIISSATYPSGLSIMDDNPHAGESWNDSLGDTSTINPVGGTVMLSNNQEITNVATDTVSGGSSSFSWSFAKGVGFAGIAESGQSTSLASFSINVLQSMALAPKRAVTGIVSSKPLGIAALVAGLLRAP